MGEGGAGSPVLRGLLPRSAAAMAIETDSEPKPGGNGAQTGTVSLPELTRMLLPGTKVARSCVLRIHRLSKATPMYSPLLPLAGLPKGKGYYTAGELQAWTEHALTEIETLFTDGQLTSFAGLTEESGLPPGQFLLHRQLVADCRKTWDLTDGEPKTHPVLHTLLNMGTGKHLITWIYKSIMELTRAPLTRLRLHWEEEFDRAIHDKGAHSTRTPQKSVPQSKVQKPQI